MANPLKNEGEWLTYFDLVAAGDKLTLKDMKVEGECGTQCKTIQRAAESILESADTDIAEKLWQVTSTLQILRGGRSGSVHPGVKCFRSCKCSHASSSLCLRNPQSAQGILCCSFATGVCPCGALPHSTELSRAFQQLIVALSIQTCNPVPLICRPRMCCDIQVVTLACLSPTNEQETQSLREVSFIGRNVAIPVHKLAMQGGQLKLSKEAAPPAKRPPQGTCIRGRRPRRGKDAENDGHHEGL